MCNVCDRIIITYHSPCQDILTTNNNVEEISQGKCYSDKKLERNILRHPGCKYSKYGNYWNDVCWYLKTISDIFYDFPNKENISR